jgi:predicted HTH transcriptional regulator
MIHDNSKRSLEEEKNSGRLSKRASEILECIEHLEECTDRQIKLHLGYQEMNHVRPRITELIQAGKVVECGTTVCAYTRKTVRKVKVLVHEETYQDILFGEEAFHG